MGTFTGTDGKDTIAPGDVSGGVVANPPGTTPGADADTIYGGLGNDTLNGAAGNDYINGQGDNDTLLGGLDNDTLIGEAGADVLDGGVGNDALYGGLDGDTYRFSGAFGVDTIYESPGGGTDVVDMKTFSEADLDIDIIGDDMVIRSGADVVTIQNQYYYGIGANTLVETLRLAGGVTLNLRAIDSDWLIRDGTANGETMYGSIFNDTLNLLGGNDTAYADIGDDQVNGSTGNDYINGQTGNDTIDGGSDNDTLIGEQGIDILIGNTGNDALYGGTENDTYRFSGAFGSDTVYENSGGGTADVVDMQTFSESQIKFQIIGDDLYVKYGNNQVVLQNEYYYGTGTNVLVETLKLAGGVNINLRSVDADWLVRTGTSAAETFYGSIFNDTFNTSGGSDTVYADIGNDTINGSTGNDYLNGQAGNDTIDGGSDNDTLIGEAGVDTLIGNSGNDGLYGGADNDTYRFSGTWGDDTVYENSGGGSDNIDMTALPNSNVDIDVIGDDLIINFGANSVTIQNQFYYGTGANALMETLKLPDETITLRTVDPDWLIRTGTSAGETMYGSIFNDTLNSAAGNDTVYADIGNDNVNGSGGNDYLYGQGGSDTLDGGANEDTLIGDIGTDTLIGNTGNDNLYGGADNDTYRYSGGFGDDQIFENLNQGTDTIRLDDRNATDVTLAVIGNDLVISDGGDTITIRNQYASGEGANALVETLRFEDGTSINLRTIDPDWLV